ncbi:MAG TPA: stage 0 sporulation family protein [Desulfomonilaceae bacterium]|nr:stage 0 sporulation family protein [Desulfomonilaceae bacterium]
MKERTAMHNDKPKKKKSYLPRSWGANSRPEEVPQDCDPGEWQDQAEDNADQSSLEQVEDLSAAEFSQGDSREAYPEDDEEEYSALDPEGDDGLQDWIPAESDAGKDASTLAQAGTQTVRIPVNIAGVRFGYACKIYHFDSSDMELAVGDWVIVKTEKGMGLGQIAVAPFKRELDASQLEGLRKVVRKAGKTEFDQKERCTQREAEAYAYCMERIEALDLPMKLVSVECFFDGSKYVFYFTAEGRVDFRELVKQLVARFPVRIEMRQIGVRHEAKMTGGLACCGQELCCSRYLVDFRPVSVKMAKNQNLSLNPTKISGVCGRLMCCLGYEHEIYEEFKKGLPRVGKTVNTPKGEGIVLKHNPLAETVFVRLQDETIIEITKTDVIQEIENTAHKKSTKKSGSHKTKNTASEKTAGVTPQSEPS